MGIRTPAERGGSWSDPMQLERPHAGVYDEGVPEAITWEHVAYRQLLHVSASSGVVLLWMGAVRLAEVRGWIRPVGPRLWWLAAAAAPPVLIFLREAYDAASIGWAVKSYIDLAAWAAGCAVTVWALRALTPRFTLARVQGIGAKHGCEVTPMPPPPPRADLERETPGGRL